MLGGVNYCGSHAIQNTFQVQYFFLSVQHGHINIDIYIHSFSNIYQIAMMKWKKKDLDEREEMRKSQSKMSWNMKRKKFDLLITVFAILVFKRLRILLYTNTHIQRDKYL